jgi:hypothetical protein
MAHRTGVVEVCEASVVIAVSSPHRQAALQVGNKGVADKLVGGGDVDHLWRVACGGVALHHAGSDRGRERCRMSPRPLLPRVLLQATQWAIDELKATVPVWKKEFFEDGSEWKENAESRRLHQQQQQQSQQQQQQS